MLTVMEFGVRVRKHVLGVRVHAVLHENLGRVLHFVYGVWLG